MKRFKIPAIVLGRGAIFSLGVIRSLGRAGVTVYHVDEKKSEVTYSRYCRKSFVFPKIAQDKNKLKKVLVKLQNVIGKAVIFPTSDLYTIFLSDLLHELNDYYLLTPKKEVVEIMINKRRFYESLLEKKIPHPTTIFPESLSDIKKIIKNISYPVFMKPYFSHQFSKIFRKKGFVANSNRELIKYFKLIKKYDVEVMIQEIILGPPTNHIFLDGYFDRNSNPKALFVRQRLRMWPLAFGNSSLSISIPTSKIKSLKEMLFNYLEAIHYNGIFSCEFKKDQRDDLFKLIEINPRTSSWFNTFSAKCGIDITFIAYLDMIGEDRKYSEEYETGIKWIFLRDDFRSALKLMLNDNLGIKEWISSMLGRKDYMLCAKDDLKPFIINLVNSIFKIT